MGGVYRGGGRCKLIFLPKYSNPLILCDDGVNTNKYLAKTAYKKDSILLFPGVKQRFYMDIIKYSRINIKYSSNYLFSSEIIEKS